AKLLKYAGYEIELARRNSSRENEEVRLEPFLYSGSKLLHAVASNPQVVRNAAGSGNLSLQHRTVAIANLAGFRLLRSVDDFVPGAKNRNSWPGNDRYRSSTDGSQDAEFLGSQDSPGGEH